MSLFNELQGLMIKYRFRPNRGASQHFVTSEQVVQRLVDLALLAGNDTVLEIGPGTGFLTRALLEKCSVVAVEADEKLCRLLQQELSQERLRLVCEDFLKAELPPFNKVVSLPPYSHSRAVVLRLLECKFDLGVLVFQREFAEKLVALPGFKEYRALSVLTQHAFEARVVEAVPGSCFFPKPKGESCIVLLRAKKSSVGDMAGFSLFVKTVFRFKNKNLKNALQKGQRFLLPCLQMGKAEFEERTAGLAFRDKKVNLISVPEFVKTFKQLAA